MKKFFALLAVCALLLTACAPDDEQKIGVIRHMNVSEKALDSLSDEFNDDNPREGKVRYVFFNSVNEMVAALKSGQIDELITYEVVGRYLAARNWDFDCTPIKNNPADAFCCAFREQDIALKKIFNDALDDIITDGTLKELVKIYILDTNYSELSKTVDMPTFYQDEFDDNFEPPIRIGVTGDLPPLDYIRPDGKPAGFNTALLAEISRRLKKNFVLVSIDSGARSVALTSKLVDVVFWSLVPTYDDVPIDMDKAGGIILTDPYFTDEIVCVRLKK